MNILLALLFIPLSYAAAPGCADLSNILQHYESELHRKTIKDCPNVDHKTLIKDVTGTVDPNFLEGKVCQDLTSIEIQLQNARLQLAVLNGIDKLKFTIQDSKNKTKNSDVAQVAARTFVASLDTAQSLEVLLDSRTADKPFIQALKDIPATPGLNAKDDLKARMARLCKGLPKEGACDNKLFAPENDAAEEILGMIKNTTPSDKDIETWKKKLAIKRKTPSEDDEPYTFTTMKKELATSIKKFDSKDILSKAEIAAIAKLDDFEDFQAPSDKVTSMITDLNLVKGQKSRVASDKFFHLIGDSKLRQQYEIQSKLSIAWLETSAKIPDLTPEVTASCEAAKSLFDEAVKCIKAIGEKVSKMDAGKEKEKLESVIPALNISVNYANSLNDHELKCRAEIKQSNVLSEACWKELDRDRSKLQDQIFQLNIVKDRIAFENQEMMKFRNFTLQKFKDAGQGCSVVSSTLDMCESDNLFSQESASTLSDTMKIALNLKKETALTMNNDMKISILMNTSPDEKSQAEAEAKELCDSEERKGIEGRLCLFFEEKVSNIIEAPKTKTSDDETPPDDGFDLEKIKRRDILLEGAGNALGTVLNAVYQRQTSNMTPVNPYPYNYTPYGNSGRPPLGIADGIMFNARYYGAYGLYMPTPGYQPGTAFGMNSVSAYKPMASSSTKYFSY